MRYLTHRHQQNGEGGTGLTKGMGGGGIHYLDKTTKQAQNTTTVNGQTNPVAQNSKTVSQI